MIKLRKPFSQKIQLHIRQDILQRLWDKYVPVSSPAASQKKEKADDTPPFAFRSPDSSSASPDNACYLPRSALTA